MRTNIDIDERIMQEAMRSGGFKTKKETVEAALKLLARQCKSQRKILDLFGKIEFDPAYDHKKLRPPRLARAEGLSMDAPASPYRLFISYARKGDENE